MADRLTQLQDAIDDYLIQCFAGLNYNYHHHPYADIPGQPDQAPATVSFANPDPPKPDDKLTNGASSSKKKDDEDDSDKPEGPKPSDRPHSHEEHEASIQELAQGLVLKEQQIEYLIQSLPGIGSGEREQERRLEELREELKGVEAERREKEAVRERLVEGLGAWIVGGRRVP